MKESKLIEMQNKVETLGKVAQKAYDGNATSNTDYQ